MVPPPFAGRVPPPPQILACAFSLSKSFIDFAPPAAAPAPDADAGALPADPSDIFHKSSNPPDDAFVLELVVDAKDEVVDAVGRAPAPAPMPMPRPTAGAVDVGDITGDIIFPNPPAPAGADDGGITPIPIPPIDGCTGFTGATAGASGALLAPSMSNTFALRPWLPAGGAGAGTTGVGAGATVFEVAGGFAVWKSSNSSSTYMVEYPSDGKQMF